MIDPDDDDQWDAWEADMLDDWVWVPGPMPVCGPGHFADDGPKPGWPACPSCGLPLDAAADGSPLPCLACLLTDPGYWPSANDPTTELTVFDRLGLRGACPAEPGRN